MADQTAADIFGATTIRPPLDPELAPVEEARGAVFPALSDAILAEIRRQIAAGSPGLDFGGSDGGRQSAGGGAPRTRAGRRAGHHCADSQPRRGPRTQGRHPQPPRWRDDHGRPPGPRESSPSPCDRGECGRRVGRIPAGAGSPRSRAGRGLLRGAGVDGEERGRARHRPRAAPDRRSQRRRRPRGGHRAARPRPRLSPAQPPDSDLPHARR